MKAIINLKGRLFRVKEVIVGGHRPLRQIHCKRCELLVLDELDVTLKFRFYIKDVKLDMLKAYDLERFISGIYKFSSISISNAAVVSQLAALFTQNMKWAQGKISVDFCFTTRQLVHSFEVGLFYEDGALVMVRK
nr:hypothetical protein [uncultured Dyadobacter sp.]